MPVFDPNARLAHFTLAGSAYGFSGTRLGALGASEWTLVSIVADVSGSVSGFERDIEGVMRSVAEACRVSPRADHLMLRAVAFDSRVHEIHGFKPLSDIAPSEYDHALAIGGATALYDAAHNAVTAMTTYADGLTGAGMAVNGLVVVITDGEDNASTLDAKALARAVAGAVSGEALESVVTVLVGVNTAASGVGAYLMQLSSAAGFDHFVDLARADARTLAGLADFVSRSIYAQSICLGTGGPSRVPTP